MRIDAKIKYEEEYLPTKRHRIPRVREVDETVTVELREIQKKDTSLALVVTNYKSYLDDAGKNHFGLVDTPFLAVDGQLYTQKRDMWGALDKGAYKSLDAFIKDDIGRFGRYAAKSREAALLQLREFVNSHLLIDGEIYQQSGEPRYVVMTFGLGHNHGGTAMSIHYGYNPNISKSSYFNALQRDEAIAYANDVAIRRGDTDYVGKFGDENIHVLMPELIRCNPNLEHGNGSPLLNSMEDLVQASSSSLEAGLFVMAAASSALDSDRKQPSLSDQIQSASSRNDKSASSPHQEQKAYESER